MGKAVNLNGRLDQLESQLVCMHDHLSHTTSDESDAHHQPSWRAQSSRANEIATMINTTMTSGIQRVDSLTMTFIPMTDDSDVIGSVSAAMTASRSAAMVILVSVRAR